MNGVYDKHVSPALFSADHGCLIFFDAAGEVVHLNFLLEDRLKVEVSSRGFARDAIVLGCRIQFYEAIRTSCKEPVNKGNGARVRIAEGSVRKLELPGKDFWNLFEYVFPFRGCLGGD